MWIYIIPIIFLLLLFLLLWWSSAGSNWLYWHKRERDFQEYIKTETAKLEELKSKTEEAISGVKENSIRKIQEREIELLQEMRTRELKMNEEINSRKSDLIFNLEQDIINYKELNKQKIIELDKELELQKQEKYEGLDALAAQEEIFKEQILQWKSKQDAIVKAFKQAEKLRDADNFNKISFTSEEELAELDELNAVVKKLKNPVPFRKAIYDIYYRQKINDMVLRVVGRGRVSGVYKITHIESGRCYVGQSVDIGDRWKQHSKRGVGAEALTSNKLYPAMMEFGLASFTFEVIETTEDTIRLNEMEKYWQDFFQAKDFGYSIR